MGGPIDGYTRRMRQLDIECLVEINRALNKFRFDPFYRGKAKRVPLVQFADYCGVSRQTLYDLVRGDRKGIEPATRDRILHAIELVEKHGLRFHRVVVRKSVIERRVISPGVIEWQPVMPNGAAPPPLPQRQQSAKQIAKNQAEGQRLAAAGRRRHPQIVPT